MDEIYIESTPIKKENLIALTLESALIIVLFKYCNCVGKISLKNIEIENHSKSNRKLIKFDPDFLCNVQKVENLDSFNDLVKPFYVRNKNHSISGLSAICREMIVASESEEVIFLLGFNNSCLQSPTERSSWTKFCEILIVDAFNKIAENYVNPNKHIFEIPEEFQQFENHLKKPLKINDKYKKEIKKLKVIIKEDCRFSEYNHPTLADVLIFLCLQFSFEFLSENIKFELFKIFPLISKWVEDMKKYDKNLLVILENTTSLICKSESKTKFEQLYFLKNNSKEALTDDNQFEKYKQFNKIHTVQANITKSFEKLKVKDIKFSSEIKYKSNYNFEWSSIPVEIHPDHGGVPNNRLQRKKEQLKCIVDIVMSLAKKNETIVDFCCGSGHLGIILAALLPDCRIIFLESKQFSLLAIKERAMRLNLKNCLFYQSNIDYFVGKFDFGISLHGCGTATDIVLHKCLQKRAKFICCPCCYGSIDPMPHISYPLSKTYKNIISEREYLYLTHAADLTINLENDIHYMDVIDTDRKLFIMEANYECMLSRLIPENCTPKNRLIIGVPK
ncbi:glutathione S-transferase C-terminal domain-containing protein homolog [Condylostylus longicornis]|uniref:glutathione S-transferase C-terminal domain-containing protein homolog n=1 Tax=Condylostylus longicornis TaxID=2530218 RepID=UPI00244E5578|nr:glutathione S-transferase C-terminal domain-containing protein homolog [Condylostylus longicornis]